MEHGPDQARNPDALLYLSVQHESGLVEARYYDDLFAYFDNEARRDEYSLDGPDARTPDDNIDGHGHSVSK